MRLGIEPLVAPPDIVAITAGTAMRGRALPVRHAGSVDVFLEVLATAEPGDVLVIDTGAGVYAGDRVPMIAAINERYVVTSMLVGELEPYRQLRIYRRE